MKNSSARWILVVLLPVAGFALGRWSGPDGGRREGIPAKAEPLPVRSPRSAGSVQDRTRPSSPAGSLANFKAGDPAHLLERLGQEALRDDPVSLIRMSDELAGASLGTLQEMAEYLIEDTKRDPEGMSRAAYDQQRMLMVALFHRLSSADPKLAVKLLENAGKIPGRGEIQQLVFANYALKDPAGASAALSGLQGDLLVVSLEGVMSSLVAKDPAAALELVSRYPGPDFSAERHKLLEAVAATDPEQARSMAQSLLATTGDTQLVEPFLIPWLKKDRGAAMAWAESYQGPGADMVKGVLLSDLAASDPEAAAAAWHGEAGLNRGREQEVASAIVQNLVAKDPARARQWVDSLQDGDAKVAAVGKLADRWSRVDMKAASAYLATLPEGALREMGAANFASAINREHPAEAFVWAATLQEGRLKARVMDEVMRGWRTDDPAAAEKAWADYTAKQGR